METAKGMDEALQKNGSKGPAQIPKTDTDSRILPNKEGGDAANYTPMVTTESAGGLIVVSDVVIGNVEHHQFGTILDVVQNDFDVDVERVMADSAYTTGENLTTAEAKNVELIGPLAERCRKNLDSKRGREVMHDEHEGARRRQRERMKRPVAQAAYSRRQHAGEVPFAVIKTRFDMRRFLLRGIEGVGQQWRWASTGFNLLKLMGRWSKVRAPRDLQPEV